MTIISQIIAEFFVAGVPKPAGSKRAAVVYSKAGMVMKNGRPVVAVRDDCETSRDWKADVKAVAIDAYRGEPSRQCLRLVVEFHMPRPGAHFRTNGELKGNAPFFHTKKPDATKLLRCIEDALTGIVWADDAQIADQWVVKRYASKPGAKVKVEVLA